MSMEGDSKIMFLPSGTYSSGNNSAFHNCPSLTQVPDVTVKKKDSVGNTRNLSSKLFYNNFSLKKVGNVTFKAYNGNIAYPESCNETFLNCSALMEIPE